MKSKKAKKKKMKRVEEELVMRIMALQENEDDVSSREGSIHSVQDSERVSPRCESPKRAPYRADLLPLVWAVNPQEDSDLESYMTGVQEDMMEFKLSYEMWRVGRWAVSIPQVSDKYRRG